MENIEKLKFELLQLQNTLLTAIDQQDWNKYTELVDKDVTSYEPEAKGAFIEGLEFHKFYFVNGENSQKISQICNAKVQLLGNNTVAIITYNRVGKIFLAKENKHISINTEETRVWNLINQVWKNVHFHRSYPTF